MCADRAFLLGVIPANDSVIPASCQYQLWISLTPLHRVDTFGVASVENSHWSFLIPEIPDLQLVPLLVVQGHGKLCRDSLAPTNDHVPAPCAGRRAVLELENRLIVLDIPQSYQPVLTGRCQYVRNFLIPRY